MAEPTPADSAAPERLAPVTGVATAIGALVVAWTSVLERVQSLGQLLGVPVAPLLYAVAGALAISSCVILARYYRAQASRFQYPDRLRAIVEPQTSDELADRSQAVESLEFECRTTPTVFLFAPPGTGKSSLLNIAFVPYVKGRRRFSPIYIRQLGTAWDRSEREALDEAMTVLGSTKERQLHSKQPSASAIEWLGWKLAECDAEPLLVFDQLDDYVTTHLDRFVTTERREGPAETIKWLNSEELKKKSTFWNAVATLVREGRVHLVFSCATEFAPAMDAFRFTDSRALNLERISRTAADAILSRLEFDTSGPGIRNPHRGWHQLKHQLLEDISERSRVVPMQLRLPKCQRRLRQLPLET